jgi:hypothetical protein
MRTPPRIGLKSINTPRTDLRGQVIFGQPRLSSQPGTDPLGGGSASPPHPSRRRTGVVVGIRNSQSFRQTITLGMELPFLLWGDQTPTGLPMRA